MRILRCGGPAPSHSGRFGWLEAKQPFDPEYPGFEKSEKTLRERGIKIDGRRGRNAIYFRDPNGYQLEYYCD